MKFKPDVTVAQDGSGNFKTVQEAINAAPDNNSKWHIIYIKSGSYKEKLTIPQNKTFIRMIGEDINNTVLTYDDCSSTAAEPGKALVRQLRQKILLPRKSLLRMLLIMIIQSFPTGRRLLLLQMQTGRYS